MPRGRPSKYKPEYTERVREWCSQGKIDLQIAELLDISQPTLESWKHKYPDFLMALKEGKQLADDRVAKSLYSRAMGYSHAEEKIFYDSKSGKVVRAETIKHYPPDPTSMIFWLKNRQRLDWRDRQDIEMTGKDGGPIETKELSDLELARRMAFLLNKGVKNGDST